MKARPTRAHANPPQNLLHKAVVPKEQPVHTQGGAAQRTTRKGASSLLAAPASLLAREQQPPFRNTRARSRSTEPTVAAKAKDGSKGKGKIARLQSVVEHQAAGSDADVPPLSLSQTGPAAIGETYKEEEAVDQLLSEAPVGPEDDMQVMKALEHGSQMKGMGMAPDGEEDDDDDDELERLLTARQAKSKSTSRSQSTAAAAVSRSQANFNRTVGRSGPSSLADMSTPVPVVTSPLRSARAALDRAAAFPSPGTGARELREKKERESKRAPYEPPEGTRASAHRARLFR